MELTDKQKELFASYRIGSTQYVLAGEKDGCFKLANDFYDLMEQMEETKHILSLHPGDLEESRDKLGCFLCFYMNGPHLYQEKYMEIFNLVQHMLTFQLDQKNEMLGYSVWLSRALQMQPWEEEDFKDFMFMRFQTPAHRIQNQP